MTLDDEKTPARVTLKNVAEAAGVSPATASFVLNNTAGQSISPATRERVEAAATALGYVPNSIARALREGSSRIVLLNLDPDLAGSGIRSFIRGLDAELGARDHVLLIHTGLRSPQELTAISDLVSPRAVIDLLDVYAADTDNPDDGGWVNGLAAHTAEQLRHLIAAGHTEICMPVPSESLGSRLATLRTRYADELAAGIDGVTLSHCTLRDDDEATLREALAKHPGVTAIAAYDDVTALRVLTALPRLGLSVPGDLAVIGFGDDEFGAHLSPALTTMRIDAEAFGRHAARKALGVTSDAPAPSPARLIRRESA